ncbi:MULTISPECIES: FAD-dependent oxidoreductase [unclassified Streptomyces]|uniref:FAD-dependent oxidoreductase n=1 Tax=unclassified Streptomyces TaxID=2593676 RepID=UPI001BE5E2D1|nr:MULTISPECIES: FAD-dependent oxidoreductase [unclassified Streptomyces]MBT2407889.1 FAD-dependent oxidoreductase [Streptomyces sp. ISL-21]MBT2608421.1 FAD-dependent oxidoreductase [Streptomyces sp. ISL-87]
MSCALHTQREHARWLVEEKNAHYLMVVKGNQPTLHAAVRALPWKAVTARRYDREHGHGRRETRSIRALTVTGLGLDFPYLVQAVKIHRHRTDLKTGKVTRQTIHFSGGSARGALTQMAQWWALSDWNYQKFAGVYSYRLVQGTAGLIRAMLADAGADLVLNSPVASVTDTGDRVRVTTRGGATHQAAKVVVAVPVNVWKDIAFSPVLPEQYRGASAATIGAPTAKKVWLHIRGDHGLAYARGEEGTPLSTIVPSHALGEGYLAYGFSIDPGLDVSNRQQLQAAVQRFDPSAQVLAAKGHDWGNDPYARGGWTFKQPGQLTRTLRAIQRPVGRLAFASSDIASGWSGWVDGAIESGLRAAAQVMGECPDDH